VLEAFSIYCGLGGYLRISAVAMACTMETSSTICACTNLKKLRAPNLFKLVHSFPRGKAMLWGIITLLVGVLHAIIPSGSRDAWLLAQLLQSSLPCFSLVPHSEAQFHIQHACHLLYYITNSSCTAPSTRLRLESTQTLGLKWAGRGGHLICGGHLTTMHRSTGSSSCLGEVTATLKYEVLCLVFLANNTLHS
jgi:hypothetical protein